MKCDDAEKLFSDALGGELATDELTEFNQHLSACAKCRSEFESLRGTVGLMQKLTGPQPATLTNEDVRSVADISGTRKQTIPTPRVLRTNVAHTPRLFRAAAGLAIAFLAGYGARSVQSPDNSTARVAQTPPSIVESPPEPPGPGGTESLRRAFLDARSRHARGSDLARCLIALAGNAG